MKNFDTRTYNISDFIEWHQNKGLELSPNFQRKSVWTEKAKSYLIDTVLRGKPMPKVLITQKIVDGKNIRTVVDGQQRLRAIINYIEDGFSVSTVHNKEYSGKLFSELDSETKNDILQYEIGVDLLFNTELSELLDIFARLNTYSVKLNNTELLNAQYLGAFKTSAHRLGHRYADFFLESGILNTTKISRMGEVEFIADLLGSTLEGISPKKPTVLKNFYKKYDELPDKVYDAEQKIDDIFKILDKIFSPDELRHNEFKRPHLFYGLFMALLKINDEHSDSLSNIARVRSILEDLSAKISISSTKDNQTEDEKFINFIHGLRNATTDKAVRENRVDYIVQKILESE